MEIEIIFINHIQPVYTHYIVYLGCGRREQRIGFNHYPGLWLIPLDKLEIESVLIESEAG